jgi:hypothetical protein
MDVKKILLDRSKSMYKYKLEAADLKLRFAAYAYEEIMKIVDDLEFGEFIYFDDRSRLKMSFHLESFLVFSRACLDLAVSSYYTYFRNTTNLDSINDFIGKIKVDASWIPPVSKLFWENLIKEYDDVNFNWVNFFIGSSAGVSLRDKSVHKGTIYIDTIINEGDKGCFILNLNSKEIGYLVPWLIHSFGQIQLCLIHMRNDIIFVEEGGIDLFKVTDGNFKIDASRLP